MISPIQNGCVNIILYVSLNQGAKETALPWKNNGEWVIYPWDVSALYKE